METRRFQFSLTLVLSACLSVFATWSSGAARQKPIDPTGQWIVTGVTGVTATPWTFDFIADGNTFNGIVRQNSANFPGPAPFSGGRIDGDAITFRVKATSPGREDAPGSQKIVTFTGKINGDQLVFSKSVEILPGGNPGFSGVFGTEGPPQFMATRISKNASIPANVREFPPPASSARLSVPTIFAGATEDISGRWVVTGVPSAPWIFDFRATASELSGTVRETAEDSRSAGITKGSIRGNTAHFQVNSPDGRSIVEFMGVVNGSEMILIRILEQGPGTGTGVFGGAVSLFTAKRETRLSFQE